MLEQSVSFLFGGVFLYWYCYFIVLVAGRTLYVIGGAFWLLNRLIPLDSPFAFVLIRLDVFGWDVK